MTQTESIQSIFDLITTPDDSDTQHILSWMNTLFPQTVARSAFQTVICLNRLFELALFENQIEIVHLLLQKGLPPDIPGDWGTTPLMWATCLQYDRIASLLIDYGANQRAKCYSGKTAADFKKSDSLHQTPEYQFILARQKEIHAQATSQKLFKKPGKPHDSTSAKRTKESPGKRQINNGKGMDEMLKKLKKGSA